MGAGKAKNVPCKNSPFTPRETLRLYVTSQPELCLTPTHSLGLGAKLAVTRVDSSTSVSKVHAQGLDTIREWTEPRLKPAQRFVGLAASSAYVIFFLILRRHRGQLLNQFSRGVYSCTSNGALRLTPLSSHVDAEPSRTAVLPMRLYSWRLAPDGTTFSYGGDGVELSVWDIEAAFAPKLQPPPAITGTESPQQQEAQTQHRATPSRRIVASEKCMFQ